MPYRDDEHVLRAKEAELERDLSRIEEKLQDYGDLKSDEQRVAGELDDVRKRLEARKKKLPVLGDVRVASPCSADWGAMIGDDRSRFCLSCAKNVYNLSAMTREEAESLIQEKEGSLCIRYYQRKDGTVLTADCPTGVRKKRTRLAVAVAAVGAGVGVFGAFYAAREDEAVMGEAAVMGKFEEGDHDLAPDQKVEEPVIMGAMTPKQFEDAVLAEDPKAPKAPPKVNPPKVNPPKVNPPKVKPAR